MSIVKPERKWWVEQNWVYHPLHNTQTNYVIPLNTYVYTLGVPDYFYTGKRSQHNLIVFYFPFKETYSDISSFTNILPANKSK
jgi:hypothetical protein